MIQADANFRANPETLNQIMVRNGNEMAPITQFVTLRKVYGPDNIKRFNMFTAISVNGSPADGYSSGQAIKAIEEVAAETLPTGFGYEFSGMTVRNKVPAESTTALIFVLCLVFCVPVTECPVRKLYSTIGCYISVPFGLMGSFIFAQFMGVENNICKVAFDPC